MKRALLLSLMVIGVCDAAYPLWIGRSATVPTAGQPYYLVDSIGISLLEGYGYSRVPIALTVKDLTVWCPTAPGSGKAWKLTLQKGTTPTALSVTISDSETKDSNTLDVAFDANDPIALYWSKTSTPADSNLHWAISYEPSMPKSQVMLGRGWLSSGGHTYLVPKYSQTGSSYTKLVFPIAGSLSRLHGVLGTAPGDGCAREMIMRVNGGETNLTATFGEADTYAADDANSVAVSAGDTAFLDITDTGSPPSGHLGWGVVFTMAMSNRWALWSSDSVAISNSVPTYYAPNTVQIRLTNENLAQQKVPALTIRNLYVVMTAAPGSGNSYAFSLRVNGAAASPALGLTLSDTYYTGSAAQQVTVAEDSYLNTMIEPSSTPDASIVSGMSYLVDTSTTWFPWWVLE